jgi:D-glycero-alpha-D-manno-heptose-7-phosphate kinase
MEPIVIARAPLSITLGDQEIHARGRQTACRQVIRAAINYYAYTIVTSGPHHGVQIIWAGSPSYRCRQCGEQLGSEMELSLPEAISKRFNIRDGLTVFLAPQAPLSGGLGLSGSLSVSMIKALAFCAGLDLDPREVAELACQIEIESLKASAINGDPYAAAYGGITSVKLCPRQTTVESLTLSSETLQALERSLLLYHINGAYLTAPSKVCEGLNMWLGEIPAELYDRRSRPWVVDICRELKKGNLLAFGQMLHYAWLDAHQAVDQGRIDRLTHYYGIARANGALGGCGEAGVGHSFLTLYCDEEHQPGVAEALAAVQMHRWPIKLVSDGVEVLEAMPRTWSKLMTGTSLISSLAS